MMLQKLKSNSKLRESGHAFFAAAIDGIATSDEEATAILKDGVFHLSKDVLIGISDTTSKAQSEFLSLCLTILGTRAGNEKDVSNLMWDVVSSNAAKGEVDPKACTLELLERLALQCDAIYEHVLPNHLFEIEGNVEDVSIALSGSPRGTRSPKGSTRHFRTAS